MRQRKRVDHFCYFINNTTKELAVCINFNKKANYMEMYKYDEDKILKCLITMESEYNFLKNHVILVICDEDYFWTYKNNILEKHILDNNKNMMLIRDKLFNIETNIKYDECIKIKNEQIVNYDELTCCLPTI